MRGFRTEGITVHPRPDERHIRYADVLALRPILRTEFNIEGYPSKEFIDLVLKVKPHQVTLVPDAPDQITSNSGWDTKNNLSFLTELMDTFGEAGIRTSIFVGTDTEMIEYAAKAEPTVWNFIQSLMHHSMERIAKLPLLLSLRLQR